MITPEQLLTDFTKDLVAHPGERQALIAGYAATMRARDAAMNKLEIHRTVLTKMGDSFKFSIVATIGTNTETHTFNLKVDEPIEQMSNPKDDSLNIGEGDVRADEELESEIDEVLVDMTNVCDDCEHPKCLAQLKAGRKRIMQLIKSREERLVREAYNQGMNDALFNPDEHTDNEIAERNRRITALKEQS